MYIYSQTNKQTNKQPTNQPNKQTCPWMKRVRRTKLSHTHAHHPAFEGGRAKISCGRPIGTFRAFHCCTCKGALFLRGCAEKQRRINLSIDFKRFLTAAFKLYYRNAGQSISYLNMFEAEPNLIHLHLCNPSCPDPCNWRREAPHRKPVAIVKMVEYLLDISWCVNEQSDQACSLSWARIPQSTKRQWSCGHL